MEHASFGNVQPYNCLSVDGDTSTNDMVLVMANGLAHNPEITEKGEDFEHFKQALYLVMGLFL